MTEGTFRRAGRHDDGRAPESTSRTMVRGRYKIVRKIADGGMAEIFLGTQHGVEGFERPVVLKRILATLLADPKFKNLLIDEAHAAMSLTHSNIVQVLDLGQARGRYYLVLEFVDGWDLNQVLHRVKGTSLALPPELALYITAEVCRALSYAHGKKRGGQPLGLVHRDVSPHNVLLSEQGEVKLTDFGIAKAVSKRENTVQGIIKGKLAFMSPEQASGAPIDARSDIFSVGTMLYLLLVGKRPFEGATDLEAVLRVQSCEFEPPGKAKPDLDRRVVAVIERAMKKNALERYQTAEELLVELENLQRTVYRPAGQTELKRWLAELEKRDGIASVGRARAAPITGTDEISELGASDFVLEDSTSDNTLAAAGEGLAATAPLPTIKAEPVFTPAPVRITSETKVERTRTPPPPPPAEALKLGVPSSASAQVPTVRPKRRRWVLAALVGGGAAVAAVTWHREPEPVPPARREPPKEPEPEPAVVAPETPPVPEPAQRQPTATPEPTATAPSPAADAAAAESAPGTAGAPGAVEPAAAADEDEDETVEEKLLARAEQDVDSTVIGDRDDDAVVPPPKPKEPPKPAPTPAKASPTTHAAKPAPAPPKPTPPAPPAPVSIRVVSRPEGAIIRFKDRVFGRAPMNLRFRPGGTYELSFVKKGYVTATKKFKATNSKTQVVAVALRRKPAPKPTKRKGFFDRIFGR